ncbi:MAG: ABC transporter permease subunit [Hyphomicrobiaceae bacterium]|nr:ABC transporter permease subunit [Hyphomicrobiaceae bacterium]
MANAISSFKRTLRIITMNGKEVKAVIFQAAFFFLVAGGAYFLYHNMQVNLERQNIQTGFHYLSLESGFAIGESWISYSPSSSYARAILVGFINTSVVAVLGITLATLIGVFVGVAALSSNWLVSKLTSVYINFLRNLPVLLQIILWYTIVTSPRFLPTVRDFNGENGLEPFLGTIYMTRQGIFMPFFEADIGWLGAAIGLATGIFISIWIRYLSRIRMDKTGQQLPVFWIGTSFILVLPCIGWLLMGAPVGIDYPEMGRFRLSGGATITPEFIAVLFGLTIYASAFIADIVRSGILSVPTGQVEAGRSLGLQEGVIMGRIVLPQALRIIIPPLTSQYLNLTKNSSLAVAVGYPDLVSISNTTLNQTGQAPEAIMIMMIVYLSTSLTTAFFMNWYDKKIQFVER